MLDGILQVVSWLLAHVTQITSFFLLLGIPTLGWLQWKRRQFLSWVNICLHIVERPTGDNKPGPRLLLRDLANVSVAGLTNDNAHAAKVLVSAAKRTRAHQPLVPISREDRHVVINMIRGHISGLFSAGFLARDLQRPYVSDWYTVGLVCEIKADIRRITVVLIKQSIFRERGIFQESNGWTFELEKHAQRLRTLHLLQEQSQSNPDSLISLELCVRE
jgi:hypothetical protein